MIERLEGQFQVSITIERLCTFYQEADDRDYHAGGIIGSCYNMLLPMLHRRLCYPVWACIDDGDIICTVGLILAAVNNSFDGPAERIVLISLYLRGGTVLSERHGRFWNVLSENPRRKYWI